MLTAIKRFLLGPRVPTESGVMAFVTSGRPLYVTLLSIMPQMISIRFTGSWS
jgi:hypothetical protein